MAERIVPNPEPETLEDIFKDFVDRRAGLLRALTTEKDQLWAQCDPEKEEICLFGLPDGTWEVLPPIELVPSRLLDPALGINFVRVELPINQWLYHVAEFSDSWLLSVAFGFAGRANFGKHEGKRLFDMINDLPTLSEVLEAEANDEHQNNNNKIESSKSIATPEKEENQDTSLCGTCGGVYVADGFWICCDVCDRWFHGKCVKITQYQADLLKVYKCPSCRKKRARVNLSGVD